MNWKSRKFLLVVVGGLFIALNETMGWKVPEETVWQMVILAGGFIGIEGIADIVSRFKSEPFEDYDYEDEE